MLQVQVVLSELEVECSGQERHPEDAPAAYVPAAHTMQDEAARSLEYFPGMHASQITGGHSDER